MILTGIDRYRVMEPLFEGLRVILSYRGETYSPAYIQGLAGTAFHVGGICPCAPTCTPTVRDTAALARLLGYETRELALFPARTNPVIGIDELIERVQGEVRAGRPALVWHAFTSYEWDVVCGFDEAQGLFYGRGSYLGFDEYAHAPAARTKDCQGTCLECCAVLVGPKVGSFDARQAEIASLHAAVAHAHSQANLDKVCNPGWVFLEGLAAYERWARDFGDANKMRGVGDAYCLGIYGSTHRAAAEYLAEIAPHFAPAQAALCAAAQHFAAEADTLYGGIPLLGWGSPEGPDAARNAQAADLLARACEHYRQGIEAIESALQSGLE